MAPSTSNLKQLLEYQPKREMLEMFDGQGQLVLIVNQFIIKLCSEDDEIIILLRSLEDSAKLCWSCSRSSKEERKFSILFWSFMAELKVFFKVPNLKNTANPNEFAAAFTDLLLEILEEILHLQPYFIHGSVKEFILTLKEELRFLITFLGDTPSQLTEHETTKNILSDIEVVANEVGCFLYSFFFSKNRISVAAMSKSVSDLLGNMELLKESIKKHCVTFANIWPSCMTPKTAVISLSFLDSILDYIDDLVHHDDDMIVDVKDQIRTIHQNLMSLSNGIKKFEIEQHPECEKFSMQLINIAYEVEYVINSFAPVWYITLRLLQVTDKIKHMRMQLQILKKNEAEMQQMLKDSEYKQMNEYMNELELSYKYLPMHLKPCFLYLGVFEKEMEIPVKKLIMLWDAERLIGKVEDKSSEDVAEEYIMHLIDKNILLVAKRRSNGRVKSCTIPGVWHDLCSRLAEKENFMKAIKDQFSIYERHQRLSIHSHSIPKFSRPFGLHIHSLLGHLPDPSAFIFSSLRHLQVLDMSTVDLNLYNLTGSGALAFLRFLAVSTIPSSIEIFKNLEFLFVDNKAVVEIPAILLNMVKLRRVHFSGGAQFSESWRQAPHDESFQMSNVQNLSSIFIYDENDEKILRSFHNLRILKCKLTVFWDSSEERYRSPALNHLIQLESLDISFQPCYESDDISSELISLPSNLRKLTLRYFDLSWNRMKIIENLPNLEILKLRDHTFAFEGNEWVLNEVGLLRLKYLELDAVQVKHWDANDINFPVLERLVLRNCHLLEVIPHGIAYIATLEKIEVHGCAKSVEDSAKQILEVQRNFRGKREMETGKAKLESKFQALKKAFKASINLKALKEAVKASIMHKAEENNPLKFQEQDKAEENNPLKFREKDKAKENYRLKFQENDKAEENNPLKIWGKDKAEENNPLKFREKQKKDYDRLLEPPI